MSSDVVDNGGGDSFSYCYATRKKSTNRPTEFGVQTQQHEPATVVNQKVIKRSQSATSGTPPTKTTRPVLYEMAVGWMEEERRLYFGGNNDKQPGYSPLITTERKKEPSCEHLVAASKEFERRFKMRTLEEEEEQYKSGNKTSKSPYLLVANNVKDDWQVPDAFLQDIDHPPVRFMLVPGESKDSGLLFITCMPGPEHGSLDACFVDDIEDWRSENKLRSVIGRIASGGVVYQPDNAYAPKRRPDRLAPHLDSDVRLKGKPFARLIIEVDLNNRSGEGLRMVGYTAMNNDYTRLFLCVKIWEKNPEGYFGAAAVLWRKNDDGTISVDKAVDFGTREIHGNGREGFEVEFDGAHLVPPVFLLPPVPVAEWTRPTNPPPNSFELETLSSDWDPLTEIDQAWIIPIPKEDLLYRTSAFESTDQVPYVLNDLNRQISDCRIYLRRFASSIQETL